MCLDFKILHINKEEVELMSELARDIGREGFHKRRLPRQKDEESFHWLQKQDPNTGEGESSLLVDAFLELFFDRGTARWGRQVLNWEDMGGGRSVGEKDVNPVLDASWTSPHPILKQTERLLKPEPYHIVWTCNFAQPYPWRILNLVLVMFSFPSPSAHCWLFIRNQVYELF